MKTEILRIRDMNHTIATSPNLSLFNKPDLGCNKNNL